LSWNSAAFPAIEEGWACFGDFLVFAAFLAAMSAGLRAETVRDGAVEVELVPPSRSLQPGEEVIAFLKMTHDPGWHSTG
jgi:hypothetical protein